jgi:hypothetical protein
MPYICIMKTLTTILLVWVLLASPFFICVFIYIRHTRKDRPRPDNTTPYAKLAKQ